MSTPGHELDSGLTRHFLSLPKASLGLPRQRSVLVLPAYIGLSRHRTTPRSPSSSIPPWAPCAQCAGTSLDNWRTLEVPSAASGPPQAVHYRLPSSHSDSHDLQSAFRNPCSVRSRQHRVPVLVCSWPFMMDELSDCMDTQTCIPSTCSQL